jgi:hypothetical protein
VSQNPFWRWRVRLRTVPKGAYAERIVLVPGRSMLYKPGFPF